MATKLSASNSRRRGRRTAVISDINITPFVDVMLVLLVIFMVTSPMLVAGIKVDLPSTESSSMQGNEEPLTITVDKKGDVYIMNSKIKRQELSDKLRAITKQKMDSRIFVRGDKNASYGMVMSVMNDISNSGFSKVALITNINYED